MTNSLQALKRLQGVDGRWRARDELPGHGTGIETLEFNADFKNRYINEDRNGLSGGIDRAVQRNLIERMDNERFYQVAVKVELLILTAPSRAEIGEYVISTLLDTTSDNVGKLFVAEDDVRRFERDGTGHWKRVE